MKRLLLSTLLVGSSGWVLGFNPYATEVVEAIGYTNTSGLYQDPMAVLGKPTTQIKNTWGTAKTARVKLVEAAYNVDLDGKKVITTVNKGQSITVKFDHMVEDDPNNPYGIDFLVFGNAFFVGSGSVSDATDMNTYMLPGGIFAENMQISVSPDGVNWHTYVNGPYADALFPTNAYLWDSAIARWTDIESDFTKPVNPALTLDSFKGLTAAQAIALYDGSGGGTGFDLAGTGFSAIQYIRVTGIDGYFGGEIDAFADVAPVPEPLSLVSLGLGLFGLALRRRLKA